MNSSNLHQRYKRLSQYLHHFLLLWMLQLPMKESGLQFILDLKRNCVSQAPFGRIEDDGVFVDIFDCGVRDGECCAGLIPLWKEGTIFYTVWYADCKDRLWNVVRYKLILPSFKYCFLPLRLLMIIWCKIILWMGQDGCRDWCAILATNKGSKKYFEDPSRRRRQAQILTSVLFLVLQDIMVRISLNWEYW
jgi:hypothetical protein